MSARSNNGNLPKPSGPAVAIVIESLGGGGAQHVASTLANAWAAEGVIVNVVTMQDSSSDAFHLAPAVRRIVIGGSGQSRRLGNAVAANLRRIRSLRGALRQARAETVVSFVGTTNILAIAAAAGLGCRVVISERNDPARQSLGLAWDALRRLTYRFAALVVANSRDAIATMAAYVPRRKLLWLPNPLRTPPSSGDPGSAGPGPTFLAVGRLDRQKGFDVLLAAFAHVGARLPGCRLTILGDGPLRGELERQARTLGIAERVTFAGFVDNPFGWYRSAMALVHPARFEGMPNAVLEAMSEGMPVIVTRAQTGLRDIVRDGVSGIVVPSDSASPLAEAMLKLAQDPALRERLGEAARAAVQPFQPGPAIAAWSAAIGLAPRSGAA